MLFAPLADVAKGGDGAKSAFRGYSGWLFRGSSVFVSIRGSYSRSFVVAIRGYFLRSLRSFLTDIVRRLPDDVCRGYSNGLQFARNLTGHSQQQVWIKLELMRASNRGGFAWRRFYGWQSVSKRLSDSLSSSSASSDRKNGSSDKRLVLFFYLWSLKHQLEGP